MNDDKPGYARNWAVKPKLIDILCRVRWDDWEATPPTVLVSHTGKTINIYTLLEGQWTRAEIDAALAERFPKEDKL